LWRIVVAERSFAAIHLAHRAAHAARLLVGMKRSASNSAACDYQQYNQRYESRPHAITHCMERADACQDPGGPRIVAKNFPFTLT